ncbi:MAG: AcrB/AcrD/AcrF family protein [Planctomycetota bacterium]|nr:MAG: AcrB/AcrD/AcrF family protein [Planctomycetota bacterium]
MEAQNEKKGPLAWFAQNHVAANLLMLLIIVGGIISLSTNIVEMFPQMSVDIITIQVPYLGATPAESEEGVCVRVEEAVAGLDGVKRIRSVGTEGMGFVMVEIEDFADNSEVLDDVKAAVDRIITFPAETEEPIIKEETMRNHVITMVLYGDASEQTLKELAEQMRDELTAMPTISQVDVTGARRYEISIEVSEGNLRRYGLSFGDVTKAVRNASLDLPGGSVKTTGGEILIRTQGQRYRGGEFEKVVILTRPDGTKVYLSDIATVVDDFEDSDNASYFDGKRSVQLQVYRVGTQNLLDLVATVKQYIEDNRDALPEGVFVGTWFDRSKMLESRLGLLKRNALFGLVLVFIVLALFLDLRLAFWTTLGIPISFMGAFWLMPYLDTSINMMSLFAFILALGIVVDDAIVVGENIFEYRQRGMKPVEAAIQGAREMCAPVTMAVLTTIFAFMPLLYIYGIFGKFIRVIPMVVIPVLVFSLIEALLILPAHLSGGRPVASRREHLGPIGRIQRWVRVHLEAFVEKRFALFVQLAVRWRYVTVACAFLVLCVAIGYVSAGFIKFSLLPKVESDNVWASLSMPMGTSVEQTREVVARIEAAAMRIEERIEAERLESSDHSVWKKLKSKVGLENEPLRPMFVHISTDIGQQPFTRGDAGGPPTSSDSGAHAAEVNIQLLEGQYRGGKYSSEEIAALWREEVGQVPGVSNLTFTSSLFRGGSAIYVEMSHRDFEMLLAAVEEMKQVLAEYSGVYDISDTFEAGKLELKLSLKESGRTLGLSWADLARQVRQGFYGDEVQRIQRGRDDVRVMVRYPEDERTSLADVENMRIRLKDGTEVPFREVATVHLGRGYAAINRTDRRRVVSVTADVDQSVITGNEVVADLKKTVLPAIKEKYPGLSYDFEGEQRDQQDVAKSLGTSAVIAMMAIFGLLAVQFRSYMQPVIIMSAIPFGLVGALVGHIVMGFDLSILSVFGIVALTGIVVNDSLIMIDLINRERAEGIALKQVIRDSVTRRFRPILLTTLTTFCGLVPMMLEKSLQARFLIPMAVSLAFGVLFATIITLILVPALYMILEDSKTAVRSLFLTVFSRFVRGGLDDN